MYKIQAMKKNESMMLKIAKECCDIQIVLQFLNFFVKFNIPLFQIKYSNYFLCVIFNFNLSKDRLKFELTPHLKP